MEQEIREAIEHTLNKNNFPLVSFNIEHPKDISHGDFATNVAMVLAKQVGESPQKLAKTIQKDLVELLPQVSTVEIAGPGFLNLSLKQEFFVDKLKQAQDTSWGKSTLSKKKDIIFEYTSPNLFKPLHVGNLVGNIVGESIARLFTFTGATVHKVNYPSDIGLSVAKGVWGLLETKGDPDDIEALGKAYVAGNTAYEAGGEAKEHIEEINKALYAGTDRKLSKLRDTGIETSLQHFRELLSTLGTSFDTEIFESTTGSLGTELVTQGLSKNIFEKSDGAVIFPGEKHDLHTRVFINSQGLPTYEAKDLGAFALKQKEYPHWTDYIIVTGNEQKEYFKVLYSALKELFPETKERNLEHIATGFLTLSTGKMSSRLGNVLTGESLLHDLVVEATKRLQETRNSNPEKLAKVIAVAALKYQILKQKVGANITFDKEQALSFEGDSGPYLQYTYTRTHSLLQKASEAGITPSVDIEPTEPYAIEKVLYRFPEVIERSLEERSPHLIVLFLTELAGLFNSFYAHERIVDAEDTSTPYKLFLVRAVGTTLKNGLCLLGIEAPESM